MRKLLNLTGLCALLLGLAVSCEPEVTPETLGKPSNLSSSAVTSTGATLTWDAVENAESYLVRINDATPVTASTTTYSASDLTPETAYTWAVQAVKGDLKSEWSSNATFTTDAAPVVPVPVPADLASGDVTHESATLSWSVVEGASGYEVKIGDDTPVAVTENTYAATGLTAETEYTWTVRATVEGKDPSDWAADATFTTLAAPVVTLTAPTGLEVKDVTTNSANLTWATVEGATGYEVKINDGTPVAVTGTTHTATGLAFDGSAYTWSVRAVAEDVGSEWADAAFRMVGFNGFYPLYGTTDNAILMDKGYGSGTNSIVVNFVDFDPNDNIDDVGYDCMIEIVTGALDMSTDKQYIDIPAGTYNVSDTPGANTLPALSDYTMFMLSDFSWITFPLSGAMTISGNHTAYDISFDMVVADGSQFFARYVGPLILTNPEWADPNLAADYSSRLGTYAGSGTPILNELNGYAPGAPTWTTELAQPEEGETSYYELSGNFGANIVNYVDFDGGKLYIDGYSKVCNDASDPTISGRVAAYFLYNNSLVRVSNLDDQFGLELEWDADTKTITYPKQLEFSTPYGIQTIMYGVAAFDSENKGAGFFTDLYTDVVLTMGSGVNTGFSGRRVSLTRDQLRDAKTVTASNVRAVGNAKTAEKASVRKSNIRYDVANSAFAKATKK